jgi:hypothetical protein
VDAAIAKGQLVGEIMDGADKIFREEGGIGSIGVDKVKVD